MINYIWDEFDSHFNRLKKNELNYEINDLNEVLSTDEDQYKYDLNGNLIYKKSSLEERDYFYDSLDRLVKIQIPNKCTLEFTYDPFNRRTLKKSIDLSHRANALKF